MTETNGAPGAEPAPAGAETRKSARYAAWSRWAAILVGLAALIRLGACFFPSNAIAACDDSQLQASLKSAIETASRLKVTGVTDIKTLSHTDKSATCSMHVTASAGPPADLTYRLDLAKDGTHYQIVSAK